MGEPGRRRISDAEQRRVQHARIKHDVHQGTLRALGLHSTVTEYELTQSGIRTLRLQTARPWNDYSGATQVAGLSSGLHANPQTAYVLRGSLGIDRDQIMRLHIAGDQDVVVNLGKVKNNTADLLAEPLEVVAVARIDKEPDQSGEYSGTINPYVRVVPIEQQQQQPQMRDLLTNLRSAVRTTEGRFDHTPQARRLPQVRTILGEIERRADLTQDHVAEVTTVLSLLPENIRPVWGTPFDLQGVRESISAANQERAGEIMGQNPPLPNLDDISLSQLPDLAKRLGQSDRPPVNGIMRLFAYNFPDNQTRDMSALRFLQAVVDTHMQRIVDPIRGISSRGVIDDVIANAAYIDQPEAAGLLIDIIDRSVVARQVGQKGAVDKLIERSITALDGLFENGDNAISLITGSNYTDYLRKIHFWRMNMKASPDRIGGDSIDYLVALQNIVTRIQIAGQYGSSSTR